MEAITNDCTSKNIEYFNVDLKIFNQIYPYMKMLVGYIVEGTNVRVQTSSKYCKEILNKYGKIYESKS